ncbi:MAG: Adenosylcobinamide-GDP ribazoletransferase [Methanonatronarchaeales archaeon]|nr:Adenosylcobinamide-GDP ribazoletransferase [Methanonatronarchaeales archaeon]
MRRIRGALAFLTMVPAGDERSLERGASGAYLFPAAGWLTGAVSAAALLLFTPVSGLVAAVAALSAAVLVNRGLHMDGLMDTGDALMCHGDRETKVSALKDTRTGSGGIAAAMSVYGLSAAALAASPDPALLILLSEVASKMGMVAVIGAARPLGDGLGAAYIDASRPWHLPAAAALTLPALAFVSATEAAAVLAAGTAGSVALAVAARRYIGGTNGDVIGASNEVGRACAILAGAGLW